MFNDYGPDSEGKRGEWAFFRATTSALAARLVAAIVVFAIIVATYTALSWLAYGAPPW